MNGSPTPASPPAAASIRSRFQFTIFVNVSKTVTAFAAGLVIARGLGPDEFGSFAFLSGICLTIRQLLDLGSATAFYTFLSRKRRPIAFFAAYSVWTAIQFAVPLFLFGFVATNSLVESVWLGHDRGVILMALAATFLRYQVWEMVVQIGESARLTHRTQGLTLLADLLYLALIVAFWRSGHLALVTLFGLIGAEYVLMTVVAYFAVWNARKVVEPFASGDEFTLRGLVDEFSDYCAPLVALTLAGFAYQFADRWMLQKFGGGAEQGFFEIGYRFSMISMIATTSVLRIFWKEIAEAIETGNKQRVMMLFEKVSRLLFAFAAAVSALIIPWSLEIVQIFLGERFMGAAPALAVMLFYPVHQTLGQIAGTMYYAMGRTKPSSVISIAFMALSIPVTYLLIGPVDSPIPGLGLASTGLALKMLLLQIVNVNVLLWWLAKMCGWRFDWTYQPMVILLFGGLGFSLYFAGLGLGNSIQAIVLRAALTVPLYGISAAFLVWHFPGLAGMTRSEFVDHIDSVAALLGISRRRSS